MKLSALALALPCLLMQLYPTVTASAADLPLRQSRSAATAIGVNSGLPAIGLAAMRRSRTLSNEASQLINSCNYGAAEPRLREALAIEPGLVSAHCNLGLLLNKTGRADEALGHLLYAREQAPQAPAPLLSLAASYQLLGQLEKAVEHYGIYLSSFPQNQDAPLIADIVKHLQDELNKSRNPATQQENFRWAKSTLKVYIHSGKGVQGHQAAFDDSLREAFLSWSQSGVLNFEFVDNAAIADVECVWTDNPANLASIGEGGEAILKHRGNQISHARLNLLTRRAGMQAAVSLQEIKALCLHEVGHALGLMRHSSSAADVMYCTVGATLSPSASDLNSLLTNYKKAGS